ncbi:MAG: SDR family NAD(P)-dependent oxidoreductase, partial [Acidobacteriota bacterium]
EWIGSGFLASGAAATDELIEEAVLPFDRRRHGLVVGMGAAAIVLESISAARERGLQPICEVLASVTANSAYHGTRLNVEHISTVMEALVRDAEARCGIDRTKIAPQMVFVSHETYTPARGGSASAEAHALRHVFGENAREIVIANTKGFTGHPMGAGIEDVTAIKSLETGLVPPVANFKEVDPELGPLNLSLGGVYPVRYALRLAAGFGSQISMSLLRWIPTATGVRQQPDALGYDYRVTDRAAWTGWLARVSGQVSPELEVVQRTLRVRDAGRLAEGAAATSAATKAAARVAPEPPLPKEPTPSVVAKIVDAAPTPVEPIPQMAGEPARSATPPPSTSMDPVRDTIVALVVEKTGYPADMLDLDLDLEADLGIDTVKQAELLAAIRGIYSIPRDASLKLRDFPTLNHVIRFVTDRRPDLKTAAPVLPAPAVPGPDAAPVAVQDVPLAPSTPPSSVLRGPLTPSAETVKERILALVVEKTGYPAEMLDLDLDLEADLGIDTVKQAELLAAIRGIYSIPRDQSLKLRDFPTLNHVIRFVLDRVPAAVTVAAEAAPIAPIAPSAAPSGPAGAPTADSIRETIVSLVVEKTGYPAEMLDLDLDLEADLGIDTVKQAELLAAIRGIYSIPRDQSLKLRDFPTLNHVIQFVMDRRPDLNVAPQPAPAPAAASTLVAVAAPGDASASVSPSVASPVLLSLRATDNVRRRVPVPVLRLSTRVCKPTGAVLGPGTRVVVGADESGTGTALAARLANRGVEVLTLDTRAEAAVVASRLAEWAAAGPIHGVFWLPALDAEGDLKTFSIEAWRAALHVRVKLLYTVARALYEQLNGPGHFLVAATRLGGQHGYDEEGALAPLGGAVTGFVKALSRERPDALVKAVDFAGGAEPAFVADRLIDETLHDPGIIEVGYKNDLRWSIALADEPAPQAASGLQLSRDTVFVVTGAAGSIVSAITADLAAASGGRFYLLDRVPEPDPGDPDIPRLKDDKEALKRDLASRLKARGEKPTPALVERELARIERAEAALASIRSVAAAGGTARYLSVDLTDGAEVLRAVELVKREAGRVDVLVHAAGLEISHFLPDKQPEEYALVFDVKSDGWFNLVHAIGDMPLRSTVAFSSIAGRFGNAGQTDYAAANDLLCKVASSFRHSRPDTRALAIDWTAWRDIGMASRGSIPKIMEQVGIEMLPPEVGIPTVRRELTRPTRTSEVVVARGLGLLLQERDARETVTREELLGGGVRPGPMVGVVTAMTGDSLTVETTLDPTMQPFLNDHRIEGTAVLPAVMGIEAFAEMAMLGAPANWTVGAVEDVTFAAPFKFYKDQPRTLTFDLRFRIDGEDLVADCRLTGTRLLTGHATPQATEHFTGRVRLVRAPIDLGTSQVPAQPDMTIDATGIYRIYFHGPAYQVLEKVWATEEGPVGRMKGVLPPNHVPSDQPAVMRPRLIELCFQTAGIWEIQAAGRMALPHRVGRVSVAPFVEAAAGPIYAMDRPGVEKGTFDAVVVDSLGRLLVILRGYGTTEVPDPIDQGLLRDVLAHVETGAGA